MRIAKIVSIFRIVCELCGYCVALCLGTGCLMKFLQHAIGKREVACQKYREKSYFLIYIHIQYKNTKRNLLFFNWKVKVERKQGSVCD